jgi:hypothetical protein
MKNFLVAVLVLGSISAFAGECSLKTKGYACRPDEFGPCVPLIKNTLDNTKTKVATAEECLSLAREKKEHFSSLPENRGAKIVFTKVKLNFKSGEETLKAELK